MSTGRAAQPCPASTPRGIVLHPLRQRYIALHGVIISCAVTDEPCLTVDSMVEGALILNDGAQVTSTPKTASARTFTILFQPKNKLDPEGFAAIASSRIELGNVPNRRPFIWMLGKRILFDRE